MDASIDLAEYTTGNAVIANSFSGTIEGQNNTVSNLSLPLFTTLSGATVKDLKIDNATVRVGAQNMGALAKNATNSNISNVIMSNSIVNSRSNQQVGGLVGYAFGSTFENVHVTASKIYGLNRVGGLIGYATDKCIIKQSSVANTDVTTTSSASALFIGETVNNTQVLDCYAVGTLTVHNTPNDCGGFIGYANNTVIHNNFAKVEMFAPANAGGFVGQVVGSADIKNNISLTNCLTTAYKFDGRTGSGLYLASGYMNNYELSDASGTPTKNKNNSIATGKHIIEISSSAINADFFRTTLQWSEEIWNLSNVDAGGLPKLLNSDPNSGLTIK